MDANESEKLKAEISVSSTDAEEESQESTSSIDTYKQILDGLSNLLLLAKNPSQDL